MTDTMNDSTTIDDLRCEAAAILNGRHDCLPTTPALIGWAAQQLLRRHPNITETEALVGSERALLAGWP